MVKIDLSKIHLLLLAFQVILQTKTVMGKKNLSVVFRVQI
jgi:hypothetical protein